MERENNKQIKCYDGTLACVSCQGPNGAQGENHSDRLYLTSCRAIRQKQTVHLFPCLHNSFAQDKLEPSLLLPAQLDERQDNNTPENICWCRLEGGATRVTMCLPLASTGGDTCLPEGLWLKALHFLGSPLLSHACRPTCLLRLPVCLFPGKLRLGSNRRGARLSEQLAAWVHSSRPQMRRLTPALLLRRGPNREAIRINVCSRATPPSQCYSVSSCRGIHMDNMNCMPQCKKEK